MAGAAASFKIELFNFCLYIFIQPELEACHIDMWNARTTKIKADRLTKVFSRAEILFG